MCKFLTDLFKKTDKPLENIIESENTDEKPEAIEETIEEEYNNDEEFRKQIDTIKKKINPN